MENKRLAALSEYRRAQWAVRPEALDVIARALRSEAAFDAALNPSTEAALGEEFSTTGGVAVIPLRGLITARPSFLGLLFGGGRGLPAFREALRDAVSSDEVGSVLIDIDSPGGSTDLITETAAEIRASRGEKPIIALANTQAASAAYWLAAQADEVVVTPSGEAGSIGVFALHEDWSGFNERMGIDPTYIYAGRYKVEGNPDEPLSDEAKDAIQATVDEFAGMFIADVAQGRNVSEARVSEDFGQGRMLTARQAVAAGMADRVETYEQTVARLAGRPDRSTPARNVRTEHAGFRALRLAAERRL